MGQWPYRWKLELLAELHSPLKSCQQDKPSHHFGIRRVIVIVLSFLYQWLSWIIVNHPSCCNFCVYPRLLHCHVWPGKPLDLSRSFTMKLTQLFCQVALLLTCAIRAISKHSTMDDPSVWEQDQSGGSWRVPRETTVVHPQKYPSHSRCSTSWSDLGEGWEESRWVKACCTKMWCYLVLSCSWSRFWTSTWMTASGKLHISLGHWGHFEHCQSDESELKWPSESHLAQ